MQGILVSSATPVQQLSVPANPTRTFVQRRGTLVVSLVDVDDSVLDQHLEVRQVSGVRRHVRRECQVCATPTISEFNLSLKNSVE